MQKQFKTAVAGGTYVIFDAEMSDEELIQVLRAGNPEIMDYIMDKYKYLVRKRANAMFLIGGENEDLIQEGMIGLFKAIRDFREEKESSFYHFADLCVSRQILNAVEASQRKASALEYIYFIECKESGERVAVFDMLMSMDSANPEQLLIDRENAEAMKEKIAQVLSRMERQVMELYLQGLNYQQIAEVMDKRPKSIDNALQRIKGKLRDINDFKK